MTSPTGEQMELQAVLDQAFDAMGFNRTGDLDPGGQKLVYMGTLSGNPAVAKVVRVPNGVSAEIVVKRAHREVELLAAVDSPNLVKVLTDAIEVGDRPEAICWAEEYLDGEDLGLLLGPTWTEDRVWRLLEDAATGLAACHELDVVHRDLSAGNVRECSDGHFVIMDPGLARHLTKTAITGHYQPGTDGFRSPEHVPGADPTAASDIFCLGILAYIALTGEFPVDPNARDYQDRLMNAQVGPVEGKVRVSADLAAVVNRCLQLQPARRFLDGAELLDAVRSVGGQE